MIKGLVSTIIPVHNRPAQLDEAVRSVLRQDHRPIEIIIVDDGSTDETVQVANRLASLDPDIVRVESKPNGGPGAARERGRLLARGEFIQYLDSDDLLLPGKFSAQVASLNADSACDVSYGLTRFRHADQSVAPGPWKESGIKRITMFPSFLVSRWWDTPNPLYRATVCARAGPWTDLWLEEDWEYDCRIASLGTRLAWCEQYVCEVREHAGERLGRGAELDPSRLRQRARSHALIFGHARRAGIPTDSAELRHFSRALFLLSRQCGAAGLNADSSLLFDLARQASGERRAVGLDFRIYRLAAWLLGWTRIGKVSCWIDGIGGRK